MPGVTARHLRHMRIRLLPRVRRKPANLPPGQYDFQPRRDIRTPGEGDGPAEGGEGDEYRVVNRATPHRRASRAAVRTDRKWLKDALAHPFVLSQDAPKSRRGRESGRHDCRP